MDTKNFEAARDIIWFAENTLDHIDFELLRSHKRELADLLDGAIHNLLTDAQMDSIKGAIDIINDLQENALHFDLVSEEEVYGDTGETS